MPRLNQSIAIIKTRFTRHMVKILGTGMAPQVTTLNVSRHAPTNKGSTGTNRMVQASFVAPHDKITKVENATLPVTARTSIPLFKDQPPASRLSRTLSGVALPNTFASVTNAHSVRTGREFNRLSATGETPATGDKPDEINPANVDLSDTVHKVDFHNDTSLSNAGKLDRQRRELLECMRTFAGEAYTENLADIPNIGNMQLSIGKSTPALKIWQSMSHSNVLAVVLGFSGTRMTESADLLCDIRGQLPQAHINPLGTTLPSLGHVGSGWQERWQSEANEKRDGQQLTDILTHYAEQARQDGKLLSVNVTGHSLGAVVATLAGADIANFLRDNGVKGKVSAYAFNPPRLGFKNTSQMYNNMLTPHPPEQDALRFSLIQLTRELDPVQSMPLFMEHPDWIHSSTSNNVSHRQHTGTFSDPPADNVNLSVNHDLAPWKNAISSGMSEDALKILFGEKPDTENTLLISRRGMFNMIGQRLYASFNQQE